MLWILNGQEFATLVLQGTSAQYNRGQCNLKLTITSPTERQCNCTDLLPALYADTVFALEV